MEIKRKGKKKNKTKKTNKQTRRRKLIIPIEIIFNGDNCLRIMKFE